MEPGGIGHSVTPFAPSWLLSPNCLIPCQWMEVLHECQRCNCSWLSQEDLPIVLHIVIHVNLNVITPIFQGSQRLVHFGPSTKTLYSPAVIVGPGNVSVECLSV